MKSFLTDSVFLGVVVSLLTYEFGLWFKKKVKIAIFNPLLISVIAVMVFLVVFHIDYADYQEGAKYISYLLTPATVCLAVPLYEQFELLRKNLKAVIAGIISGVFTSMTCILVLLFRFDHQQYVTLLPKSITTAIGMGVSEELGGYVTITVAVIIITGIFGYITADAVLKLFHIRTYRKRDRNWFCLPCCRNCKSDGTRRDRGGNEQPFHCGFRYSDCCCRYGLC